MKVPKQQETNCLLINLILTFKLHKYTVILFLKRTQSMNVLKFQFNGS